jgi:PKD repeat protein
VVQAGEDIAIQNSSSDPEGHIASYDWSFGDGTTSSQATPAKSYAAPGTYAVTLKVTDDKGSWSFASKSIRVDAPPTAQIIVAASQTAGIAVQFDSSSSDSDGTVQSYAWDFGDGTQGSGGTPVHTYAAAGSYNVQLTVTDNDGASGHAQVTVNVAAAPTSGGGGPSSGGGSGSNTGAIAGDGTGAPTITNTSGGGSGSPADAAATGAPASSDTTAPALVVPATLKAKKKAGKLVYRVSVDEAATLKAQLKGKVAGAATVKITKAASGKVVIKLSGKARKALRAAKSVKLTLVTTATDAAGNTATKTTKVTLV